jgi:hypothetical protein
MQYSQIIRRSVGLALICEAGRENPYTSILKGILIFMCKKMM